MFCTNCGNEVIEKAIACTQCGVPPRLEKQFCWSCGVETNQNQIVCVKCGVGLSGGSGGKTKITSGIIALLLGGLGVHKFYHGSWGWGIVYLLFCWTYVPAILGLIEGIIYLTMDDAKFATKYNSGDKSPFKW